jgi:hypothetical protein
MEIAVSPSPSNRFFALTDLARCYPAIAATVVVSCLASAALANTITFETAPPGAGFTGPVTENGFTYSKLSGALFVNNVGNPGKDIEGTGAAVGSAGGGVLKLLSGTADDFNFNALDFAAFNILGTGSQTLRVEGFLDGSSVGVDQYTLANTKVFNPKYDNWTTEAASVLASKSISELDISLNASIAGSGSLFNESVDNVVLTSLVASVPEPASLSLLGAGVLALGLARRPTA